VPRWALRAPGFVYPPTGEYPADSGLTVVLGRLIVTTEERGEAVSGRDRQPYRSDHLRPRATVATITL
jgi:hypothetical protein